MNAAQANLKKMIDDFLTEGHKSVDLVKKNGRPLSNEELEGLAEKIWKMRHFALELLESHPDESTWYNASIIRELTDQPLQIDGHTSVSLVKAADEAKKEHRVHALQVVVKALAEEDMLREVLFGDLEQISRELAA